MLIEIDKEDLISFILGVDDDLYDSRFVNSLDKNLKEYGLWLSAGWDNYWHWDRRKLYEASFVELAELYKLVKTLK